MVYTYCLTNGFYTRYTMMVRTNTLIPNINKKDTLMNSTSLAIKKKKHLLSNYYLPNDMQDIWPSLPRQTKFLLLVHVKEDIGVFQNLLQICTISNFPFYCIKAKDQLPIIYDFEQNIAYWSNILDLQTLQVLK
jgi:hypothetical protein